MRLGTRGPMPRPAAERFWALVQKSDGCWLWLGYVDKYGYGTFRIGSTVDGTRRKVYAHRWAYEQINGPAPDDVDHDCHNKDKSCPGGITCRHRRCVRPDHLIAATRSENLANSGSMSHKGRR